jgi:hypothetical protein
MAISQDEIKSIVVKHATDVYTRTGTIGVEITPEESGSGQPQYSVKPKTGTLTPDPDAINDLAEIIARSLIDLLPRLVVETTVGCKVSGTTAEGKGHGTIS